MSSDVSTDTVAVVHPDTPDGRVRMRHVGPLSPEVVRDKLQPLLRELRQ